MAAAPTLREVLAAQHERCECTLQAPRSRSRSPFCPPAPPSSVLTHPLPLLTLPLPPSHPPAPPLSPSLASPVMRAVSAASRRCAAAPDGSRMGGLPAAPFASPTTLSVGGQGGGVLLSMGALGGQFVEYAYSAAECRPEDSRHALHPPPTVQAVSRAGRQHQLPEAGGGSTGELRAPQLRIDGSVARDDSLRRRREQGLLVQGTPSEASLETGNDSALASTCMPPTRDSAERCLPSPHPAHLHAAGGSVGHATQPHRAVASQGHLERRGGH